MAWQVAGLGYRPRISLALVVSDADEVWIKSSVDSILQQAYPYLELRVCDNASERPHVSEALRGYAAADERVKVQRLPERRSWEEACNAAISGATGDFVTLVGQGDELAPEALFKVVELLQHARADVVYTDEDRLDVTGGRSDPVFKPHWSPDLLLSADYIGRLCVVSRDILDAIGAFREGFEGAREHDLALRLSEKTDRIVHLPEVLYHRRALPGDPGEGRTPARAVEDALARRGADAGVDRGLAGGSVRVVWPLEKRPTVSVIVFDPEGSMGRPRVDQLESATTYPIHQVIVASVERSKHPAVDRVVHPFPARALNLAAGKAGGDYLAFVDARTRVTDPGWLGEMVRQARRREAGVVGCKVLGANGGLRHGGSLVRMGGLAGPPEEGAAEDGRYLPLVDHAFNPAAASLECMVVRRASFEGVGGFDDTNLPTAFYDMDLSFRLRETGLLCIYTPHAQVVCEGSRAAGGVGEIRYMWNRWWGELVRSLHYERSPLHPAHHGLDREALAVISP